MKTNMKALLIDCIKQEVTEINIKSSLKSWYNALSTEFGKVSLVEVVYANLPNGDAILCDEEGMYANVYGGIQLETTGIQLINNWVKSIFTRKSSFKKRLKQISKAIPIK